MPEAPSPRTADAAAVAAASPPETAERPPHGGSEPGGKYLALLCLTALGIVYGDIGTSPLYAVRFAFLPEHRIGVNPENVLGVLSLVFWSLIIVISIKYLGFILRADNRGEGGILALASLATPMGIRHRGRRWALVMLGLFGTALMYGDGMITPAISVLSAVEGLEVATPLFRPYIIPITIGVLVALFVSQHHGTARVGRVFGPVMLLWFVTIAALGISHIIREPRVLAAINPLHGYRFFAENGWYGFVVLGSVFFVVTGGEAMYADMGHFGRRPIRVAWFVLVLPALLLNYFGQGSLLIHTPAAVENPFYHMVPAWALYPVVAVATAATVIASQALISGSFSLTMQAVQLGYIPRVEIEHTSAREFGQIYIPGVNWMLMAACIGLVLGFGTSGNLAAAYGVGVSMEMVITTLLFFVVARERWKWSLPGILAVTVFFLTPDLAFWLANMLKLPTGGWFPLLVAAIIFSFMTTWKRGRQILAERLEGGLLPAELFLQDIRAKLPARVPGTAVFMYSNPQATPPALLHNLKHNKVLHERVVFLVVETEDVPHVPVEERSQIEDLGLGFFRVTLSYGFMEEPDVPRALQGLRAKGLEFKPLETTYFLGRETLIPSPKRGMAGWREHLFTVMHRNARTATSFFGLPPNRVVELGAQIEL